MTHDKHLNWEIVCNDPVSDTGPKLVANDLLDILQAAKFLTISVPTMRRLQQARYIPFTKIGGSVRFLKKDLEAYIAEKTVPAIARQ